MDAAWIALIIFIIAYVGIASEKLPRQWVALSGGGLLLVFGVLGWQDLLVYINWETLGLLTGMFVLVAVLHEAGFFEWLAMVAVRRVNYHPTYLFFILMTLATSCAMFMDSITVMLFLSALTIQLCRLLRIDPVPLVIGEVCVANTGGAATLVGDPPNVILGTTLGFNFGDFALHTGPIALLAAAVLTGIFYFLTRKNLRAARTALDEKTVREIEALHNEPLHARMTRLGLACFGGAVVLLILHKVLEPFTGLHIDAAAAALVPAGLALAGLPGSETRKVLKKVDYQSLLFFTGLFVLIGGLEKTHWFEQIALSLAAAFANSQLGMVLALNWGPGLASGILDNVPLALAMSFVLKDLAVTPGMPPLPIMTWALALGVDIGGNITPIGASANVVAYAALEHQTGPVGWKRWLLLAAWPTLVVMVLISVALTLKLMIGWY